MSPPRVWLKPNPRLSIAAADDLESRDGLAPVNEVDNLVRSPFDVKTQRQRDLAALRFDITDKHRRVSLPDSSFLERARECALRVERERHDEETRGVHIEAVHHHRAGGVGERRTNTRDDAVLLFGPDPGDGKEPGRLVNNDKPLRNMDIMERGWLHGVRGV